MTSLSQFSAARIPQSQIELVRAITGQAFTTTEKVLTLNIRTTRASIERSSQTVKQLFSLSDPRDLFALGSQTQEQFQSLLAYSRELFGIIADAGLKLPFEPAAAPALPVPAAAPVAVAPVPVAPAAPAAPAASAVEEPVAEQVAQSAKAPEVVSEPEAAAEPIAKAKPVAKAVAKVAPKGTEHPAAAPVASQQEIELPALKPVEAAPPPAPHAGTPTVVAKHAEASPAKAARKK